MLPVRLSAVRFAAALLGCLAPVAAIAAETEELEEIYVYGRSLEATLPQELAEYGSDLVSVGRSSIEQNVYVDPQQALQMQVPGLYITPVGPFSYSYVSIQGSRLARFGPSDVLWLVDGVRLNNRLYSSTLSDTLPANMVERIEVLKGGESLFYGTNAAGGVINIVSRDFSDSFGGDVSAGHDTNGSYSLAGMLRGPAGPGNFVLFGSQDESDGYRLWNVAEPSATDRHQSYDVFNVGAKYGIDFTPDLRLVGQYQHTEGDIDNIAAARTNSSVNSRNEEIASVRLDYAPVEGTQFFLKGYFHDWDTRYTTIQNVPNSPGTTIVTSDNLYWGFNDHGINALAKFRPSRGGMEYLLGYDYQRYSAEDEVWQIAPMTETVHAYFGQVRTSRELFQNGAISAGVRHNDAGTASATVWNVSGKYEFSGGIYVQGSASTNFTLPNAEQLFLNEPCCEVGNPNLDPEETTNYTASIGAARGRHYWQVTGFHRKVEEIIGYDYDQPAFPNGIFNNLGEAKIRGFEVLGGVSLTDSLRAEASYTRVRARIAGQDRQMDYNPREFAKGSLTLDRGRFGGSLAARWTGDVAARVGAFGDVPFGNTVVADLSAFYQFDQAGKHQFSARLENLLDEDYVTLSGYRPYPPDDGGPNELAAPRGVPRTLHVSYRFRF